MVAAVLGLAFGDHAASIADATSCVVAAVAVEKLAPASPDRNAYPIILARDGREVARDQDHFLRSLALAQQRDDAARAVIAIDPLKAGIFEFLIVQRRLASIEMVQVAQP